MLYSFDVTPAAQGIVTVDVAAGVAADSANNGNSAAAQFSISYGSAGLPVIELTVLNDGTDAVTILPNPVPAATPAFVIVAGGSPDVSVNPASGEFAYAFAPGALPGMREVTLEISSGGQVFEQIVRVTVLDAVPIAPTATLPPPPVPLCEDHNFDEGGVVRSGTLNDALAPYINCRVLYQNGASTSWLGSAMYGEANLGVPGLLDLGLQQAVDVFSPGGLTYFDGGAVFCLRGSGTLIWLAASGMPRHPEIIGSYSVPEFAGFTCVTLFEPGTLALVRDNPVEQE